MLPQGVFDEALAPPAKPHHRQHELAAHGDVALPRAT